MKKCIRMFTIIFIIIFLITCMTGCWDRHELDTLAIIMGIGVDKPAENGKVQLTAQAVNPTGLKSPNKEGGGSGKAYVNLENIGNTVFDALNGLAYESSRKIYLQHSQVIIFGMDMVKEGIQKHIDFFARSASIRANNWVLVSGSRADSILEVKSELKNIPANNIADLLENQADTSQSIAVTLGQLLTRFMSKTTAAVVPLIDVVDMEGVSTVIISGTAVLKDAKLKGLLNRTETRGFLWVAGEIKGGVIVTGYPGEDGKISFEILRADRKITPQIKDGKVHIKIEIKEEGSLRSQSTSQSVLLQPIIKAVEKEKADVISREVMAVFKKAQELNADIFGFGEMMHQKYPKQWKTMKDKWDKIFPNIEIEVIVKAKVVLPGRINRPVSPG